MPLYLLSPLQVCLLILLNIFDYEQDQQKKKPNRTIKVRRARISDKSIKLLSGRKRLDSRFLQSLYLTMQDLGWYMIPTGDPEHLFIRINATENWAKIGTKPREDFGEYDDYRDRLESALNNQDIDEINSIEIEMQESLSSMVDDNSAGSFS